MMAMVMISRPASPESPPKKQKTPTEPRRYIHSEPPAAGLEADRFMQDASKQEEGELSHHWRI